MKSMVQRDGESQVLEVMASRVTMRVRAKDTAVLFPWSKCTCQPDSTPATPTQADRRGLVCARRRRRHRDRARRHRASRGTPAMSMECGGSRPLKGARIQARVSATRQLWRTARFRSQSAASESHSRHLQRAVAKRTQLHDVEDHGRDDKYVNRRCDHAADNRCGNWFHDVGTDASAP